MLSNPAGLVGREREIARLKELLESAPLVTLTGPGGVGKTSLAAQVCAELAEEFAGGAVWCELAPLQPGASVALAVAAALGAQDVAAEDAEARLPELVAGRPVLVVLDNCEHVTDRAAAVASRLAGTDGTRVLATSRETLGATGEHVVSLDPLEVPQDDTPEAVGESEAGRLFVSRAAAARDDFALDEQNAPDVARLCRRLDGLPLALELAAARTRSLTPREVADRLDERFALLARRKSQATRRHHSLRATVDWSYGLLSEPERTLFARLGVFSSAVAAPDVEEVCGDPPLAPGEVVELLDQLVDRSLVTVRDIHGATRYGMLETLRQYARERLEDGEGLEQLRDRHAQCYMAMADELGGEQVPAWRTALFSDVDEGLAAVRWCLERDESPDRAFRLLSPLWLVAHSTSAAAITELAERALERWPDSGDPLAVKALGVAAVGHFVLGQPAQARRRAREAVESETPAAPALVARRALALVAYNYDGNLKAADAALAELVSLAERTGAELIALEMAVLRAQALAARGDVAAGLVLVRSVLAKAEPGGNPFMTAWTAYVMGTILLAGGSEDEARAAFTKSLDLARRIGFPLSTGTSLRQLGMVEARGGDHDAAAAYLLEAVETFRATGDRAQLWDVLRSAAVALAARGEEALASEVLAAADAAPEARTVPPLEQPALTRLRAELPPPPSAAVGLDELVPRVTQALAGPRRDAAPRPAAAPLRASEEATFRREGRLWTLAFGGQTVQMPHLKGFIDIATLLAQPGKEIHCLDLASDGSPSDAARAGDVPEGVEGDLGEVVDKQARDSYRARAEELSAEIEEARRANDPARAERAQEELAAIGEALESAYGLGGRVRRTGDPAERARTAVTWRIRNAVKKIEPEHPALARHLRNAVRTGTWCSYEPEVPVQWRF